MPLYIFKLPLAVFNIFVIMFKWLTILLLIVSSFRLQGQNRELEIWNKNQVQVKPFTSFVLDVAEKVQYSTGADLLKVKYAELNVGHTPVKWLKYGLGYRLVDYNLGHGVWLTENRPMLFANLNEKVHDFAFSFSNRLEYRTFLKADNHFRHRQSFSIYFPSLAQWGMTFYVSEETFLKFTKDDLHLARFYSGLNAVKTKRFDMNLYYALQKNKLIGEWHSGDVLGLDLHFRI